jgi:carbon storage regulator CsrA
MLIMNRRIGEVLHLGADIQVTIVAINNREVRLAVVAPPAVLSAAEEVHERARHQLEQGRDQPDQKHISWR